MLLTHLYLIDESELSIDSTTIEKLILGEYKNKSPTASQPKTQNKTSLI
jgi:hypothetical protein